MKINCQFSKQFGWVGPFVLSISDPKAGDEINAFLFGMKTIFGQENGF